jgi:GDPmannose 4,6-dehydratase
LIGDPTKAKKILRWEAKTKFKDLVRLMVEADVAEIQQGKVGVG